MSITKRFFMIINKHSSMKVIQSEHHGLRSHKVDKLPLLGYGDKRHVLDNGIASYIYGH